MILGLAATLVALSWVGYVGSDDQSYARGALGWLNGFPYVGENHWQLRHPLVIPVAVSLAVFGYREISLGIPSAIFFLLFLGVNYYYLQRFFGARLGLLASLFLATTPLFVVYATFAQTVTVEVLLLSASFWFFYSATQGQRPAWSMLAAGVALGLGFLIRETAIVLVMFYGILFVLGFGQRRRDYWLLALGFVLIVGMEMVYLGAFTGDPLYRYKIDWTHESGRPAGWRRGSGDVLSATGNLEIGSAVLRPVFSLLLNQEFGVAFWLFIFAAIWAWRSESLEIENKRLLQLLSGLALLWMAFISYGRVLATVPRFYSISLWAGIVVVACWMGHCLRTRRQRLAASAAAAMFAANLLCIYVENKDPLLAERALVDYVRRHDGIVVHTDPTTLRFARLLLEFHGVSHRVTSDPAPPASLYFFNKKSIDYCRRYGCAFAWEDYLPRNDWRVLMRVAPERKYSGLFLSSIGFDGIMPKEIFERLDKPNPGATLYLTSPHDRGGYGDR